MIFSTTLPSISSSWSDKAKELLSSLHPVRSSSESSPRSNFISVYQPVVKPDVKKAVMVIKTVVGKKKGPEIQFPTFIKIERPDLVSFNRSSKVLQSLSTTQVPWSSFPTTSVPASTMSGSSLVPLMMSTAASNFSVLLESAGNSTVPPVKLDNHRPDVFAHLSRALFITMMSIAGFAGLAILVAVLMICCSPVNTFFHNHCSIHSLKFIHLSQNTRFFICF
jgi:hypothetical protein